MRSGPASTRVGHATSLQPNHRHAGTQPANISLTASRQRHVASTQGRGSPRGARPAATDAGVSPCPLDRRALHISCQVVLSRPRKTTRAVASRRRAFPAGTACSALTSNKSAPAPSGSWTTLAVLAHVFVAVLDATERSRPLPTTKHRPTMKITLYK
jgi:hypothetical protein